MKTFKYISLILIFFSISCCVNQQQKDEEQIKNTVKEYWKAVKADDLEKCKSLIDNSETFSGGIQGEFYFLQKNYGKINPNDILLQNIKVKDTTSTIPSIKLKYVQYIIKEKNDPDNLKKPLIITYLFYDRIGYDKIFNASTLQNHIGWGKN